MNPANGSMLAADWFDACDLSSPPTSTNNYLLATSGHVVLRRGNTYYYHPGVVGAKPKTKEHSSEFKPYMVGLTGTVKYKII